MHQKEWCDGCEFEEIGALDQRSRIVDISMAFIFFGVVFTVSWTFLHKSAKFRSLAQNIRADLASRVGSSVHALIIVPLLIYGIYEMEWDYYYVPQHSVAFLQRVLCFTVGYFLADFVIMVYYRTPRWQIFCAHHFAACTPYLVYMFVVPCPYGLFLLCSFLLVEATNPTLNILSYLKSLGKEGSAAYAATLYCTAAIWPVFRLANPLYLIVVIHWKLFPSIPRANWKCVIPSVICAYFILCFCIGGFVDIVIREVVKRWRANSTCCEITSVRDLEALEVVTSTTESAAGSELTSLVKKTSPSMPASA